MFDFWRLLLIQNSPRQFSPWEGHGLIKPAPRGASVSDDSDRASISRRTLSPRGGHTSAPSTPPRTRIRFPESAMMQRCSLSRECRSAIPVPPRCAEPSPPAGRSTHRLVQSCACPTARVFDEDWSTELSAPPHYPWYAAAARRRRCRSRCQQLTAVKSCLLLLLRSIILDLLHYSCKSKLWAKTANHDHWRCRMLVSQAKIELQLSNMIQAQQSKKNYKVILIPFQIISHFKKFGESNFFKFDQIYMTR